MNDDAKFFFCLGGFVGFLFFFSFGFALHGNATFAVLLGALGCLFISLSGRFLLDLVLRGNLTVNVNGLEKRKKDGGTVNRPNLTKEKIDPTELAAEAMSEAATSSKPLVETKA